MNGGAPARIMFKNVMVDEDGEEEPVSAEKLLQEYADAGLQHRKRSEGGYSLAEQEQIRQLQQVRGRVRCVRASRALTLNGLAYVSKSCVALFAGRVDTAYCLASMGCFTSCN
jgi:hypothetical protein